MIFSASIALLTASFPPESRGQVLGINTAATYTGLSLGPVIGGFLVEQYGWRSIFYVTFGLGLLALFSVFLMVKGAELAWALKDTDTPATVISRGLVIYSAAPAAAFLMLLYSLELIVKQINEIRRGGKGR